MAQETLLEANCLDSMDVPPLMIKIPENAGYDEVARKITEALQALPGKGEEERVVRQILHGGFRQSFRPPKPSSGGNLYSFSGEPVLFRLNPEEGQGIQVNVITGAPPGPCRNIPLALGPTDTIGDLKEIVKDKEGIPPEAQSLMYLGDKLEDESATVSDFDTQDEAQVNLYLFVDEKGGSSEGCVGGPIDENASNDFANWEDGFASFGGMVGAASFGGAVGACGASFGGAGGAGGFFADMSDSSWLTERAFSTLAPDWRVAAPGLCLEGRCTNYSCKAHNKMVILNHGFRDFDLMRPGGDLKHCPECEREVVPSTCGFTDCVWRYKGRKAGDTNALVGAWKEAGDSYHKFKEGGEVQWDRLLIQARPRPKKPNKEEKEPASDPSAAEEAERVSDKWSTTTTTTTTPAPVAIDHTWTRCTRCSDGSHRPGEEDASWVHVVLECGHRFHAECLAGWERDSMIVCPNCREESPPPPQ